jgi:hypothetical protein
MYCHYTQLYASYLIEHWALISRIEGVGLKVKRSIT